jgi:hypothetical protein
MLRGDMSTFMPCQVLSNAEILAQLIWWCMSTAGSEGLPTAARGPTRVRTMSPRTKEARGPPRLAGLQKVMALRAATASVPSSDHARLLGYSGGLNRPSVSTNFLLLDIAEVICAPLLCSQEINLSYNRRHSSRRGKEGEEEKKNSLKASYRPTSLSA